MTASLQNSNSRFVVSAAILGIVQGLIWSVLSIISISIYNGSLKVLVNDNYRFGVNIEKTIYQIYLDDFRDDVGVDYDELTKNITILSKNFNVFMYFYTFLSIGLLLSSSVILWASLAKKSEKFYIYRIGTWTVLVALISILDLIFMGLIAHDYASVNDVLMNQTDNPNIVIKIEIENMVIILTSIGIVMTLAARGFTLWIVNVIFAAILGKHCFEAVGHIANYQQPNSSD